MTLNAAARCASMSSTFGGSAVEWAGSGWAWHSLRVRCWPAGRVPHTCHDVGTTTVIGSHSKALETTYDLEVSRSASTMKWTP